MPGFARFLGDVKDTWKKRETVGQMTLTSLFAVHYCCFLKVSQGRTCSGRRGEQHSSYLVPGTVLSGTLSDASLSPAWLSCCTKKGRREEESQGKEGDTEDPAVAQVLAKTNGYTDVICCSLPAPPAGPGCTRKLFSIMGNGSGNGSQNS